MAKYKGESGPNKSFPWKKLAGLKVIMLETPFAKLDGTIEDLSETLISLEKTDPDIMDGEEDMDITDDDDWDPLTEYGKDEIDDEGEKGFSEESEAVELEIEKEYESGVQLYNDAPELEIIKDRESFIVKVNTYEVSSRWMFRRIGDKGLDNAGNAVVTSLILRSEILEATGKFLVDKLYDYLRNMDNPDRHWYLRPLLKSDVLGKDKKSNVTRVVNSVNVLLPNGEVEELNNFFDETEMPVSSKCIATEIGRIIKDNPKIANKAISAHIRKKAKQHKFDIRLSVEMVRHWRKKYGLQDK